MRKSNIFKNIVYGHILQPNTSQTIKMLLSTLFLFEFYFKRIMNVELFIGKTGSYIQIQKLLKPLYTKEVVSSNIVGVIQNFRSLLIKINGQY